MYKFTIHSSYDEHYEDYEFVATEFGKGNTVATCCRDDYDEELEEMCESIFYALRREWTNDRCLELKEFVSNEDDVEFELVKIRN